METAILNHPVKCIICRKSVDKVLQINMDGEIHSACYTKSKCFHSLIDASFRGEEYTWIRAAEYKPLLKKVKRESTGLALRFKVMKRDGFQCVYCGKSGAEARLEIDHIHPVSLGGLNSEINLQTLCFDCNRGKGNKQQ